MTSLKLTIKSGNAAMVDNGPEELARLLRETADQIMSGRDGGRLMDYNGNKVGTWEAKL